MLVPHVTYGRAACGINHLYIQKGSLHFTSELTMVFNYMKKNGPYVRIPQKIFEN